jgi:hypothetical protein
MKHKVCIFNDRTRNMHLQVQNGDGASYDVTVLPKTHFIAALELGEGQIPYLKIWETGQALISYINPTWLEGETK